jgi:hypothetical protein
MTGILLIAVGGVWLVVSGLLSQFIAQRFSNGIIKVVAFFVSWAVLLPLPATDELIARPQVEALCRENAVFKIDEQKIKGRRVKLSAEPLHAEVPGIAIPVTYTRMIYRDEASGEGLASRGSYVIKGGVLIRALGISESNSPLFVRSYCAPSEGTYEAASRLEFEIVKQLR